MAAAAADEDQARKAGRSRTGTSRESALTRKFRSSVNKTTSRRNRLTPSIKRRRKKNGINHPQIIKKEEWIRDNRTHHTHTQANNKQPTGHTWASVFFGSWRQFILYEAEAALEDAVIIGQSLAIAKT